MESIALCDNYSLRLIVALTAARRSSIVLRLNKRRVELFLIPRQAVPRLHGQQVRHSIPETHQTATSMNSPIGIALYWIGERVARRISRPSILAGRWIGNGFLTVPMR